MMERQLYKHQQRFLDKNPDRALLLWETQTGKTPAACEWIKKRSHLRALVICPKAIVEKWERDLVTWDAKATVVSMSQIHKVDMSKYDVLVLDEAQHFASPVFTRSRSLRTEAIYNYVKARPDAHVLLLSATPIRSTPWNAHTLGTFIGQYWDWRKFRAEFFVFTDKFGKWHWEPKSDWRVRIRPYIEKISDIVLLRDCVDVPTQHETVIQIPWTKQDEEYLSREYADASKEWHNRHRAEQGRKKFDKVMELLDGYRKALVVCHYTQQIDNYVAWIGNDRQVYVLDGRTRDQDATIEAAKAADDCVFIVQASMGAGFSASEFSCVIFASMSFRFVDMIQMLGRVKVITDLHENNIYYLIGGKCDYAVYSQVKKGLDYHPPAYYVRA